MPRFVANLTMLWNELPVLERFRAAAAAGFRRVEILFVHDLDGSAVEAALREHRLELWLFDPRPGDWAAGERGLLSVPGRESEFLETVREAIAAARRFGTRRINALAGIPKGASPEEARKTAVSNLRAAAPLVAAEGMKILVEAINNTDMPGYFAATADIAAGLVSDAGSPAVRLQLDQYHVGMASQDAREMLRKHRALVEHVQIADVPGRHQPGTGKQPIAEFLADLDAVGYEGAVGLEYRPQGTTEESLGWLPRAQRG
ncbi:MAG: hydroxypyruvate isomerase family protein [Myxococcales bacterium]